MNRVKFRKEVGEIKDFYADDSFPINTPIDEVIDWIANSKMHGATHVSWRYNFHSKEVEAQAIFLIIETNEEWSIRTEKELQFELKNLEADKIEYERLKKIFDNK